ncbi:sensor histidine kinase [Lacisediminihabitans sp. H27-G8]|uniref:sensor histidine kinase n=1 Tax=Lacisediminihabitans sp. H27-G8 TaxID=3111909 RepID=UPI0038FC8EA3
MSLSLADAHSALEASALHAALTIDPMFSGTDQTEIPKPQAGQELALYDVAGRRVAGTGPSRADTAVISVLAGRSAPTIVQDSLVAVVPTASAEAVTGAVRASMPIANVWGRILWIWAAMVVASAAALAIGVMAARSLSRQLMVPIEDLVRASHALGDGDFAARTSPSGLEEIDAAGRALNVTAQRLSEAMTRERNLTSSASHQLRTPLTGLRALFENALTDPRTDLRETIRRGIERADVLDATIGEMMSLVRGRMPGTRIDVTPIIVDATHRWTGEFAKYGRPIQVMIDTVSVVAIASEPALRQILDILLDNALRHGRGGVLVRLRDSHDAVAIDVEDAGSSIEQDQDVFASGFSTDKGTGLGLSLARQLASDVGGQVLLSARAPRTRFAIVLIANSTD